MRQKHYVALLDANVLYPAPIRDLLLQLAVTDIFHARWTDDIHEEWINALLRNEPFRTREQLDKIKNLMNMATRDSLITGHHTLIDSVKLPDLNDRHVLSAAIIGKCNVIITQNQKDFPLEELRKYGLETQHPDIFLLHHLHYFKEIFLNAVFKIRARLKNPPYTIADYLYHLEKCGLKSLSHELAKYKDFL